MRHYVFPLLYFSLASSFSYAEDLDHQINKACLRHAVSLVAQLKNDVVNSLDKSQSDKALKIAKETCQAYFKKEFSENPEALTATSNKEEEDGSVKDWLTEKILSDDTERKKGNKRLERLK